LLHQIAQEPLSLEIPSSGYAAQKHSNMSWYSILPAHLTTYETWIVRIFIFLAILNFAPWLFAILFDLALYIVRRTWHEVPVYGGRARGETRPRAPSLADGRRRRTLSLAGIMGGASPASIREENSRQSGHVRSTSNGSIQEVDEGTKKD